MNVDFPLNSPVHHDLLRLVEILRQMTEACVVIELPGGCTLETVPKIHMDAAREWLGVPEPRPQKLSDVFNLIERE